MPKFVVSYQGGIPADGEAAKASRKRWDEWLKSLGRSVVDRGNPGKSAAQFSAPSLEMTSALSGYSLLEASDLAAAKKLLAKCPIYGEGGSAAIAELVDLKPHS